MCYVSVFFFILSISLFLLGGGRGSEISSLRAMPEDAFEGYIYIYISPILRVSTYVSR